MLIIIGTLISQPGKREEVLEAVLRHRDRCMKEEAGLIAFQVLVPEQDDVGLMLYELYTDEAALSAHMKGASLATLQAEVATKVVSLTGVRCRFARSDHDDMSRERA